MKRNLKQKYCESTLIELEVGDYFISSHVKYCHCTYRKIKEGTAVAVSTLCSRCAHGGEVGIIFNLTPYWPVVKI